VTPGGKKRPWLQISDRKRCAGDPNDGVFTATKDAHQGESKAGGEGEKGGGLGGGKEKLSQNSSVASRGKGRELMKKEKQSIAVSSMPSLAPRRERKKKKKKGEEEEKKISRRKNKKVALRNAFADYSPAAPTVRRYRRGRKRGREREREMYA